MEMCTINGRPLVALNDSGFRKLLQPILDGFNRAGVKLSITLPIVHDYLTVYAHRIKDEIRREIGESMISIQMDIVKRLRRSILGINAQFIRDDKIVIRTLNMFETNSKHSGEYICSILMQTLSDYGISKQQIYSITTDNGPNIVKSVDLYCEYMQQNDADLLDGDFLQDVLVEHEHDDEDDKNCSMATDEDILQKAAQIFENESITKGLGCAAHTIQLIVTAALSQTSHLHAAKLWHKFRVVGYMLNKPNILNMIRARKLPHPKRDTDTRWSSAYYLLERLKQLKSFCMENEKEILGAKFDERPTEADWIELDTILQILKPFESITTRLQAEQLTPFDFFGLWEELKYELIFFRGSEFADASLKGMDHREHFLYNELIFASVYLDPRYRFLLTERKTPLIYSCYFHCVQFDAFCISLF